jgi:S1-C subfamily serine protease
MSKAAQPKQASLGLSAQPGPNGGALVETLMRFGSLAKAGILVGDEVVLCNGNKIVTLEQWKTDLEAVGVGNSVTLTVVRNGQTIEMPMKILERKTLSLEVKALEEVLERKISPSFGLF